MIVKAFKKCCISDAIDGTEDDILWQHEEVNDAVETEELQDEPTDPHDDEIPLAEYQELFFGDHVEDSDHDGGSDNDS